MGILISLAIVAVAIVVGNMLFHWRSEPARIWGDFSQMLYAVGGILVFSVIALGFEGAGLYIAAVFIVFYVWVARTKASDLKNSNWRAALHGGK